MKRFPVYLALLFLAGAMFTVAILDVEASAAEQAQGKREQDGQREDIS